MSRSTHFFGFPCDAIQAEAAELAGLQPSSRPNGLVVLRRGKLSMRVGMSQEELTQVSICILGSCTSSRLLREKVDVLHNCRAGQGR
jgi:hypothetical protein